MDEAPKGSRFIFDDQWVGPYGLRKPGHELGILDTYETNDESQLSNTSLVQAAKTFWDQLGAWNKKGNMPNDAQLYVYDSKGNHLGWKDGELEIGIPGSTYSIIDNTANAALMIDAEYSDHYKIMISANGTFRFLDLMLGEISGEGEKLRMFSFHSMLGPTTTGKIEYPTHWPHNPTYPAGGL